MNKIEGHSGGNRFSTEKKPSDLPAEKNVPETEEIVAVQENPPPPPQQQTTGLFWRTVHAMEDFAAAGGRLAGRAAHAIGDKITLATHGVAKWIFFSKQEQEEFRKALKRIGGEDECISQMIDLLTPHLAREVLEMADRDPLYHYLKPIYGGEEDFLDNLLRSSFLRVLGNVAIAIEKREEVVPVPHLTVKILSTLTEIVKRNFATITPEDLAKIQSMEEGEEKKALLLTLFTPAAEELLQIGFPGGAADLKINSWIQGLIFRSIRDNLTLQLSNVYLQVILPRHHREEDLALFEEKNGGAALRALVSVAADQGTRLAKSMAKEGKDFLPGLLPPLLPKEAAEKISSHLASELTQLADAEDPATQWIFDIVHANLSSFATRVLARLAKNSPDQNEENVTAKVLKNFLGIATEFFQEQGTTIDAEMEEIDQITDPEEAKKKKQELLQPFVEELLKKIGLEDNPLVEKVKPFLPEQLFLLYQAARKTFPEQKPEDLAMFKEEGGAALQALVSVITEQGTHLSEKLIRESKDFLPQFLGPLLPPSEVEPITALASELGGLANSNAPTIQMLLKIVRNNLNSFATHLLIQLARSSPDRDEKNVTVKLLKNLLTIANDFFGKRGTTWDAEMAKIDLIITDPKEAAKKKQELLHPFIQELLKKTGLEENPLAKKMEPFLPDLLLFLYKETKNSVPQRGEEDALLRRGLLATLVRSEEPPPEGEPPSPSIPPAVLEATRHLPALLIADQEVNKLELGCQKLARILKETLLNYVREHKEVLAEAFSHLAPIETEPSAGKELADAIAKVMGSSDENVSTALSFAESTLTRVLYRVFVLVAENAREQAAGEDPIDTALHKIVDLIETQVPHLEKGIQKIMEDPSKKEEEREGELNALFVPIAREILAVGGKEGEMFKIQGAFPLPEEIKPLVIKALEENILPQMLRKIYSETTPNLHSLKENQEELGALAEHAPPFIRNIADYVKKYVPFYLENNADKIADLVMKKGGEQLDFLGNQKEGVKNLLQRKIYDVGVGKWMNPLWEKTAQFAQGFITKALLGAFKNLKAAEAHGKTAEENPFLNQLLLRGMEVGEKHFKAITKLQHHGEAYNLSHESLLLAFQAKGILHEALEIDLREGVSEEERKAWRLEHFFQPLAKNLLVISRLKPSTDLPLPSFLKGVGWDLLQDQILPEILMNLYDEMQKPENIDQLMTNLMDTLKEATDVATGAVLAPLPSDPAQKELNENIGTLIKALVGMLPGSAAKTLMGIKKINELSAEVVGDIVRRQTNATSLLDLVDLLMGKIELKDPTIKDTRSPDEIKRANARATRSLRRKMVYLVSRQIKRTVRNWIEETWNGFQKKCDTLIETYLGLPGRATKTFLDWIFGSILYPVLPIFDFILFRALWGTVDLFIWARVREVVRDCKMPIHENLVFNITDKAIQVIKEHMEESKPGEPPPGKPTDAHPQT